jgi:hypothetical protein
MKRDIGYSQKWPAIAKDLYLQDRYVNVNHLAPCHRYVRPEDGVTEEPVGEPPTLLTSINTKDTINTKDSKTKIKALQNSLTLLTLP